MGGLFHLGVPWYELVIRSIGIYLVLLLGLRVFGKREVGQFTLFDLVFVLLVANAVQPAMTGPDASLFGGVIIVFSLLTANWLVGRLDDIPAFHRLVTPPPTVLFKEGSRSSGRCGGRASPWTRSRWRCASTASRNLPM